VVLAEKKAGLPEGYFLRQPGHLRLKTRSFPLPTCEGFGFIGGNIMDL
jgi:hypothetical protein